VLNFVLLKLISTVRALSCAVVPHLFSDDCGRS